MVLCEGMPCRAYALYNKFSSKKGYGRKHKLWSYGLHRVWGLYYVLFCQPQVGVAYKRAKLEAKDERDV